MTISEALKKYHKIEIELLLAHMLRKSKEFLFINPNNELSRKQENELKRMVKRRLKGEPIAYILGYKDFMGLRFKVNKDVLIPRPETEGLVEMVLANLMTPLPNSWGGVGGEVKNQGLNLSLSSLSMNWREKPFARPLKILDLGTGSGCIIISLAKILKSNRYKLYASDISIQALKVAKANARSNKVKIKFIHTNILENVSMSFDIIIANLPYGWKAWKNNTSAETIGLKYEPKQALFTKENGLMHIRRLLEQIASRKQKPGLVYLEFDPRQKTVLQKLIKKILPEAEMKFHKDYNNLWRYMEIKS